MVQEYLFKFVEEKKFTTQTKGRRGQRIARSAVFLASTERDCLVADYRRKILGMRNEQRAFVGEKSCGVEFHSHPFLKGCCRGWILKGAKEVGSMR